MAIDPTPLTDDEINEALRALSFEKAKRRELKGTIVQIEKLTKTFVNEGGDLILVEQAVGRYKKVEEPKPSATPSNGTMVEPTGGKTKP